MQKIKGEYVAPTESLAVQIVTREQAKKALDDLAWNVGQGAVNHLRQQYPAALQAVPKTCPVSLRNHIRNKINSELWPIIEAILQAGNR